MLSENLGRLYAHYLRNSVLAEVGYFHKEAIDSIVEEHVSGKVDHGQRLWLLTNVELWYRLYLGGSTIEELEEEIPNACL